MIGSARMGGETLRLMKIPGTHIVFLPRFPLPGGEFAEYSGGGSVLYVKPGVRFRLAQRLVAPPSTAMGTITDGLALAREYNTNTSVNIEAILVAKGMYNETAFIDQDIRALAHIPQRLL